MTMKVVVTSEPERDELFAEIHQDDQPWAEIALESQGERFLITIYPPASGDTHVFELTEVESAFAEAKDALIRRGYRGK